MTDTPNYRNPKLSPKAWEILNTIKAYGEAQFLAGDWRRDGNCDSRDVSYYPLSDKCNELQNKLIDLLRSVE